MKRRPVANLKNEIDAVLLAGRILMESGAEVFRIETTMNHIADSLAIEQFEVYVVNQGIIASGTNQLGYQESKVMNVNETTIDLGKLEAVNALSRSLSKKNKVTPSYVFHKLKEINERTFYPVWVILAAYFFGAGGFSLALGSSPIDSFTAAMAGILAGWFIQIATTRIHTPFLTTILASAIVSLSVNLFYFIGLGETRSIIILGALMIMVPGGFFVNAIREISHNNFAIGFTLLMSALMTCISISAGVAGMTEILPFADQMTGTFATESVNVIGFFIRTFSAGIGTIAFSITYNVPKRYLLDIGIIGAISWLLYMILKENFGMDITAVFIPGLFATLVSKILAARRKTPMTIFLSTSMFPLIPGLSFYRGIYFLLTGSNDLAMTHLRTSFITAFAITIAISIIQQFPLSLFKKRKKQASS
ncbi:threonine/serine exporter family protein [Streptococcus hyovaginalis]|uniref:threonine/serine ThrE exporter family protein n=1 Tax=Streptococcus hyovaginalis TaxID=149015 RepID=UPI002A7CF67B|nr:threonine/serine exporter family protein [Streptococcus hyovaginalis]MDY3024161.1 threonine/serine exporter family protein [Streptococcus hyovaginalis]MDY4511410.1 threonine/serine exporter family protein [Streptococcus hyovaginalis]